MIWIALALGVAGLLLSGFFSGLETGFYRVTRIRLVLEALGGDRIAGMLLWLTNHPSLFIATCLVGNTLADYVTSLAAVLAAEILFGLRGHAAEIVVPLLLTPVVFVYGDLLPKNLFLHAPNRLLRKGGPLFALFVVLFFPVAAVLWAVDRMLAALVGETPERVRLTIARRELRLLLEEGHQVGLLQPAQRELAQGIFAVAKHPVSRYVVPLEQMPRVRTNAPKAAAQQLACQYGSPLVVVEDADQPGRLAGYTRAVELHLDRSDRVAPIRSLIEVSPDDHHLDVLMRLHSRGEDLAEVVDSSGRTLGLVTAESLRRPLFEGSAAGHPGETSKGEPARPQG